MTIFYVIFILSLLLNTVFLAMDVVPTISAKIERKIIRKDILYETPEDIEARILNAALRMVRASVVTMIWKPNNMTITQRVWNLFKVRPSNKAFKKYSYPRGFLLYGLVCYLSEREMQKELLVVKQIFDQYLTLEGKPTFILDKVDQAPFGSAAILLYKKFEDEKYLLFANSIFDFIKSSTLPETSIVSYRRESSILFNDTLGMIVPFLIEFQKIDKQSNSIKWAQEQVAYFIKYGVDIATGIPVHGFNDKLNKVKLGSANWGRGIGWYFSSLSLIYNETGLFKEEFLKIEKTLISLQKTDGTWPQFLGGTDESYDASVNTLLLFSLSLIHPVKYDKSYLLERFVGHLSHKGELLDTSGDTIGLNRYSFEFGKSELSQGFLLLTLANSYKNQ